MKRFIVLLGVAGVSVSAVLVRWSTAPSLILVLYRMLLVSVLMTPVVLLRCRAEFRGLSRRDMLLCLTSGLFLGIHFTAYFTSLRYTSIASSEVLVDTEVFFVALGSVLLWKQHLSHRAWLAIVLTFCGSVTVALADTSAAGSSAALGDLLALAGAGAMAVYTMIGAVCRKRISTTVYTFLVYISAAVTVLVIALLKGLPLVGYGAVNWLTALGLAVFCTLLGHSVFSWGLKYLSPAFISTVKLLGPVCAAAWGLLLFHERIGLPMVLGGLLIIGGIALYNQVEAG